jgi:hypothetical protein
MHIRTSHPCRPPQKKSHATRRRHAHKEKERIDVMRKESACRGNRVQTRLQANKRVIACNCRHKSPRCDRRFAGEPITSLEAGVFVDRHLGPLSFLSSPLHITVQDIRQDRYFPNPDELTYIVDQLPATSILLPPHSISPKHTKGRKRRKARGKSYVCPLRTLDPDLIHAADRWSLSSLPTEPKLYVRAAQLLGYEHMQQPERIM